MRVTRSRSSSVPRPSARHPAASVRATRSRAKSSKVSPALAPQTPAFLADNGQDIIPLAPIVQQTELVIPVEDVLKAPALPGLIQEGLPNIPAAILDTGKTNDPADLLTHLSPEPAISLATAASSRMYSDKDIREIIRSVMTDYTISSESIVDKSPFETVQQNTGSQILLDVVDDVSDLQSAIEIDLRKSQDNSLIESRRVTVKEYTITTTHQSTMAVKINLSNDGATNRKKLKELELLLNECELFTLAEEKRVPVPSNDYNPNGYTHESAKFDGSKIIITKKDDYFRFNHDCERLFAMMNLVTNKDLHYLITQHIDVKNGIEWYKAIKAFAQGERSNESGLSRELLDDLKLPSSKSIKENIAAFEEAVTRVNNVNLTCMTESEKLYLLTRKLKGNKQEGMESILYTSKGNSKGYRELVDQLIRADPPTIKAFKMNAITEENVCRNFLKGSCTFGERCKYSHKTSQAPGGKPSERKPQEKSYDKSKTKYHPPQHKKVSFEHRSKIGTPRGKPSEKNPEGYSIKQLVVLKSLIAQGNQDGWQDPTYFDIAKSQNTTEHLNVFKTNTITPYVPPKRTERRRVVISEETSRVIQSQEAMLKSIDLRIKTFREVNDFVPTIKDLLVYVHKYTKSDLARSTSDVEATIFTGFRWQSSCNPLHNMCKENFQVKDADPRVMELIYENSEYFNARVEHPIAQVLTFREYNLYRPSWSDYHPRGEPGHYMSRANEIDEFYVIANRINIMRVSSDMRNVLMLGLVYDFMSYAAEHLNVDIINRKTIMAGRVIMRHEIKRLSDDPEYVELHMLTRIFHAIVDSVRPPFIQREAPPPQEVRTFSVMSASDGNQETCYDDLSGIDTEDDMEYEDAMGTFDQPNYWEDTSDATISPTAALRNKDTQRGDTTPPDKPKSEREIRNLYNFPDTPENFTPKKKKEKKAEVRAAKASQEYDHKTYDADTFPIQPPLSPAESATSPPHHQSTPSKSPGSRPPPTPQSTPQRVAIGMYANGAPRWGYVVKRTQGKDKASVPNNPTSSSMTSSSSNVMATSKSPTSASSGSAASRKSTRVTSTPQRSQSGPSASQDMRSVSAAPSSVHSASAASPGPRSGSAAPYMNSRASPANPPAISVSAAPPSARSASAAPIRDNSASAAPMPSPSASEASPGPPTPALQRVSRSGNPFVVDLTAPTPPRRLLPKLRKSKKARLNLLHAVGPAHRVLGMASRENKVIIDSGASTSGTGIRSKLKNLRPASCTVNAAFGETITPSEMGDLPPYMLPTIVIEGMKDTTLLSVSQACAEDMCAIFTSRDCRFYGLKEVQPHLATISKTCKMKLRGEVEDGLYIQKSI